MLKSLLTGTAGGVTAAVTGPQLQPVTSVMIAILGGGLVAAGVALYKARSEKNLSSTQAMALLFEKQREVNLDLLKQRDAEVVFLRDQLEHADGDRTMLEKRLVECQRDRLVLKNQLRGLQATLDELQSSGPS